MTKAMLRTFQSAVALLVLTLVTVAILVVLGVLEQDPAMRIAGNVAAIIGICLVASLVLMGLFGLGAKRGGTDGDR